MKIRAWGDVMSHGQVCNCLIRFHLQDLFLFNQTPVSQQNCSVPLARLSLAFCLFLSLCPSEGTFTPGGRWENLPL